jgi:hypothetical protein
MQELVRFLGQRLVMVLARGVGIERELHLVVPAEVETRSRRRVVTQLRRRMALATSAACAEIL